MSVSVFPGSQETQTNHLKLVLLLSSNSACGGVEAMALGLLRSLPAAGVEAKLAIVFRENEPNAASFVASPDVRYLSRPKPTHWRRSAVASRLLGMRRRLVRFANPDSVLLNCNLRHPVLNALAVSLPNRKIGWIHCNAERYGELPVERLNALSFRAYDRILTCSAENRNDFAARFPRLDRRTRWIYNGIDRQRAERLMSKKIEPPGPYILFAGRLETRKGVDVLLDAFAKLTATNTEHQLVLLGTGSEREPLERRAASLGVSARVHFRGITENVYPWMAGADAFVLPSRQEGLPLVLIEAITAGTPVIATDCKSGPREILENGTSGILVPVDDREALGEALRLLTSDASARRHYQRRGNERSRAFDLRRMARQVSDLVAELQPQSGRTETSPQFQGQQFG